MANGRKAKNIGHYNNRIVAQLLLDKPLSCIEMSKKIKLTHTATSLIVDRLLNMDLLRLHAENISKRTKGRQHVRYEINPERGFFVCLNFQNGLESLTVCDIAGKTLYTEKLPMRTVDADYLEEIIPKVNHCIRELGLREERLAVVSVAIPGRLNNSTGQVIVSSKIDEDINLKERLQECFPHAAVEIKNDIVYACMGSMLSNEFDYSGGTHLFTHCGSGLSCCLVYDKKIVEGANGFGGEIGMNTLNSDGLRLHDVVSLEGVLQDAERVLHVDRLNLEEAVAKAEENQDLKAMFIQKAEVLGTVLRNIVDIAGCSHIVFSGVITKYPPYFFDVVRSVLEAAIYGNKMEYRIQLSTMDTADVGQVYLSRFKALDWVMEQY